MGVGRLYCKLGLYMPYVGQLCKILSPTYAQSIDNISSLNPCLLTGQYFMVINHHVASVSRNRQVTSATQRQQVGRVK